MRASDNGPWWLLPGLEIIGFEGDDEADDDETEDEDTEDDDDVDDDDDEETSDDDEDDDDAEGAGSKKKTTKAKKAAPNIDALKSALRKERIARKAAERENKRLKAAPVKKAAPTKKVAPKKGEAEEVEEVEDNSAAIAEAERKAQRMATRLREKAVDAVILRYAGDFQDPGDVLKLVNRSEIEVDQDDDDPSEIEVDEESVEDAVKALAKKKKHLLKSKEQQRSKSGSKMNGRRTKTSEPSDQALRDKYSALRH